MDRDADIIYLDTRGCDEQAKRLMVAVCRMKGLEVRPFVQNEKANGYSPSAMYRGIRIDGAWPIIEFLNDIRPAPELYPGEPQHRGFIRSVTDKLIFVPDEAVRISTLAALDPYMKDGRKILLPSLERPSLVDLAIACIANNYTQTPYAKWMIRIKNTIKELVRCDLNGAEYEETS